MRNKRHEQNKKNRASLMERLGTKLDISPDIISGIHIEMRGRNNLIVRGCRKILLYTTGEVRLRLMGETLIIIGSRLYCTAYHNGAVEIDGMINSVSFDEEAGKAK